MSRMMLLCLLAGQLALTPAVADDDEEDEVDTFDRTPVDCITVSRVRRTEVVDGRTVLFHLRGGNLYRVHLQHECPGLAREERFMYETTAGRLCAIDNIWVLENFGLGLQRGASCRLGPFYPMSPEELEELRSGPGAVEVRPVEPRGRERRRAERESAGERDGEE